MRLSDIKKTYETEKNFREKLLFYLPNLYIQYTRITRKYL